MENLKSTVLVLDDERFIRDLIKRTLQRHNFKVLEAGTAEEARQTLATPQEKIDLFICDVALPDEPGPSVIEHVRTHHPEIKILLISGFFDGNLVPPSLAVLSKPFNLGDLLRKVRELLDAA